MADNELTPYREQHYTKRLDAIEAEQAYLRAHHPGRYRPLPVEDSKRLWEALEALGYRLVDAE